MKSFALSSTSYEGMLQGRLNTGLAQAGYSDTLPILQGSAVTGKGYATGAGFDVGRVSDFDIALSSESLFARAKEFKVGLRSAGTRTEPLTEAHIEQLGLRSLRDGLETLAGRPVNFMIYKDAATAVARSPSVLLP